MEEFTIQGSSHKNSKVNPMQNANILTTYFYTWLLPLFIKGYKKDLEEEDLYQPLKEQESHSLGNKLEEAWNDEIKFKEHPTLWRVLLRVFRKEIFYSGLLCSFTQYVLRFSQPILLSRLLSYYVPNQTEIAKEDAYIYCGLLFLSWFTATVMDHVYVFYSRRLGIRIRISCASLIYRKALKLTKTSLAETTTGQIVNLVSNDVSELEYFVIDMHVLWSAPIEMIIIALMIYYNLGFIALTGIGFLVLCVPFEMFLGKKAADYREKSTALTDNRVKIMNEIINGIKVIKMYTWEIPFSNLIADARKSEIKQVERSAITNILSELFVHFGFRVAVFICILTYVLTNNSPEARYVYVVSSFYEQLRVIMYFPIIITLLGEAKVSEKRIRKYLIYKEIITEKGAQNGTIVHMPEVKVLNNEKTNSREVSILMKNIYAKWESSSSSDNLRNINLSVNQSELLAVVGPVGSGKSTLLNLILKELNPNRGCLNIKGNVSYASQEAWIFDGSVRQNVLFGEKYNSDKYNKVLTACALQKDLKLFPHGDRTIVGERGVMLSGGQKARINLARTVYKDADIYLLDDPLSAVDAHVGKQLFENCICSYLQDKCTILVTHQVQYLKNVDKIYVMEDGEIQASGTYEEIQETNCSFSEFLNENTYEANLVINEKECDAKNEKTDIKDFEVPTINKEERNVGKIRSKMYGAYIRAGENTFKIVCIFFFLIFAQTLESGSDYFLAFWVNLQEKIERENTSSGNFSNETYFATIHTHKSNPFLNFFSSQENCLLLYGTMIFVMVLVFIIRDILWFKFCMAASVNLHNNMFNNIVKATMHFFNTNASGRILNRFSKDLDTIDTSIPSRFMDTVVIALIAIGVTVIVGSMNPWIFILTFIVVWLFYGMRVVFLATSRDLKRIESTARSPVFSHLTATLHGLTTIRALKAESTLTREFDNHQDSHTSASFMFVSCSRAFGFWLDMFCMVYNTLVISSLVFFRDGMQGGNIGLAITESMSLTLMLQWGMRQWSELENQMTSVERVIEYTKIPSEPKLRLTEPPRFWPEYGKIEFRNVSLKYSEKDPYVLKNITLEIKPKEKIGIVGRTGAGKSSLISVLFRLVDFEGTIIIDGISTKDLDLKTVRSKLSVIPQEPVLFSGTLRKNLDPFEEYSDELLWSALEDVELKTMVSDLTHGLYTKVSEGGSNYSVGQRQLLCLARAILRSNKILVLDEATANVDLQTDSLIQSTIKHRFSDCTVLTIAHRLHTVMDSDKVLVMNAGEAVEFNAAYQLLQHQSGLLYQLVQQTGKDMATNLQDIAREAYINKKEPKR